MAEHSSPKVEAYVDSSPTSPLTPLSPSALPQWIQQSRPRSAICSRGRIRIALIALGCMLMGWTLTSILGPSEQDSFDFDTGYDVASGGVLDDPTSGVNVAHTKQQPGIIGENDPSDELEANAGSRPQKEPTVSGALSELHHAVKGKIQSWSPYRTGSSDSSVDHDVHNTTHAGKHKANNPSSSGLLDGETVHHGMSEEESLGARTRIGKCTILFNSNNYWERAIRTHERHDREHGYRLHVLRQQLMDDVWSKPAYILSLLLRELAKTESERLDWIFWVDADTVILNPYIPIEVFLPKPGSEFDDIHLMYSSDWNGLNNGVFPVRVSQWSVQLFSAITSFRHYRPEVPLIFRDQSAMDMLMKEPAFISNIVETPQRWFNAYQGEHNETLAPFQIRRGDFLVHFAGVPNREERMNYWLERAEQHLEDWEIPLKSTSYLQEVKDFWAEHSAARKEKTEKTAMTRLAAKNLTIQIEHQLLDYGDRLLEPERAAISAAKEKLDKTLEDKSPTNLYDTTKLEEATTMLTITSQPLAAAIDAARKSLLTSAHEAIFAAEKDLLEGGFDQGIQNPELQKISQSVKHLKGLVMTPQEHWNRHEIIAATNSVTEARAALQSKTAALIKGSVGKKESAARGSQATDTPTASETDLKKGMALQGLATAAPAAPSVEAPVAQNVVTVWTVVQEAAAASAPPLTEANVLPAGADTHEH